MPDKMLSGLNKVLLFYFLLCTHFSSAEIDSSKVPPWIQSGALEVSFNGSLTLVEGLSSGSVFFGGHYFTRPGGTYLLGFGTEIGYSHVRGLDAIDVEGNLSFLYAMENRGLYPFITVGGGIRQEWVGSFRQIRYPLGAMFGIRFLLTHRVGMHWSYRFRRILNDPVSNFTKHQFLGGISIYFRNEPQ